MKINPGKTKWMRTGKEPRRIMRVLRVGGQRLEWVESFKYGIWEFIFMRMVT